MAVYRFDGFEFDSGTGDLQRSARRVRLRPQPARALEHLLKHPGELVTRTELQRAIWPAGTFVHFDDGLDSCIKQIRAALGGRAAPTYLETLVRRGFRFTAPVTVVSDREPAAHRVARLVEEILAHLTGALPVEVSDGDRAGSAAAEAPLHFLLGVTVRRDGQRMLVTSRLIDTQADEDVLLRSQGFQQIEGGGRPGL